MQRALQHHHRGELQQAEQLYQQILAVNPHQADANHFLGVIAHQIGHNDDAVLLIQRAIQTDPQVTEPYNSLGEAFRALSRFDEAVTCYGQAISLKPDFAEAHYNLAATLQKLNRLDEAVASYRMAISIKPDYAKAHNNLGVTLQEQNLPDEAISCFTNALAIQPDFADVHNNYGSALQEMDRQQEAISHYERALALEPDFADAHNNFGNAVKELARHEEAITHYRKALTIKPDFADAHSNLLLALNYPTEISQKEIHAASKSWNRQHARPLVPQVSKYGNDRDPGRKLKIGYISPDFRSHSVAYFFEPLLKQHSRARVETHCYANVRGPDAVTRRLEKTSDHWCSIVAMTDQEAANRIREDEIDILVDLAGHTANNSLLVLARKPAPVQVNWLGYPNTTGLESVDYRFTDEIADPVGVSDTEHSEELIRLAGGFLSYQAIESASPQPRAESDHITFGSFNNLAKVVPHVVALWIEILHAVPDAHLLLKSRALADREARARYRAMFRKARIDHERIELHGHMPRMQEHLQLYGKVDIGLDPFPYNGTTTTCEALWMGVPVITLLGNRHAGRVGASLLNRVGLSELIAADPRSYIDIAVKLADDADRLAGLRGSLRETMMQSELCNSVSFAKNVEDAYRQMWRRYLSDTPA
jgi:predicted O-linked N-acetylglucosamine transferase (SPINDLY family)|tara:strand:+ start:6194 stop:8143 length:1950 start_codon:yes stop_codon:yes gene_type:complete